MDNMVGILIDSNNNYFDIYHILLHPNFFDMNHNYLDKLISNIGYSLVHIHSSKSHIMRQQYTVYNFIGILKRIIN